jgi:hypothetical protein
VITLLLAIVLVAPVDTINRKIRKLLLSAVPIQHVVRVNIMNTQEHLLPIQCVLIVLPVITKTHLSTPLHLVRVVPKGGQAALALPRVPTAGAMSLKNSKGFRVPIAPRESTKTKILILDRRATFVRPALLLPPLPPVAPLALDRRTKHKTM